MFGFILENVTTILSVSGAAAWMSPFFSSKKGGRAILLLKKIIDFAAGNVLKAKNDRIINSAKK